MLTKADEGQDGAEASGFKVSLSLKLSTTLAIELGGGGAFI